MASREPDRRLRAEYGGLALVFAERAGRLRVWEAALEGWNVEESVIGTRWKEMGRREGKAEGKAEGRVEGAEEVLLRQGRKRFGEPDAAVLTRLDAQIAAGRVGVLADLLLVVESWDELLG